jgi:DNA-binding MarR family transcriptional regulator
MTTRTKQAAKKTPAPKQKAAAKKKPAVKKNNNLQKKWGSDVISHGHMTVPALLLQSQALLKIRPTQMNILLQLLEHWWAADGKVFPSVKAIGERVRLGNKQVQRHVKALEDKGLVVRRPRFRDGSQTSNEYDMSGLVKRLKAIAAEVTKAKKLVAAAKKPNRH